MIGTLKEAVYEVVHNSGVPVKVLADDTGIGLSYLYNAANVNLEEFQLQAQMIIPLTKRTGNYAILDRMEAAVGRVAFKVPEPGKGSLELTTNLLEMVKHLGELSKQLQESLEDNKIDRREAKQMEELIYSMVQHCMKFLTAVAESAE